MDKSPLARLPAELRNNIYELALSEHMVHIRDPYVRLWRPPALLHSPRQIRSESILIYYAANSFQISSCSWDVEEEERDDTLARCLHVIGAVSRSIIRKIYLGSFLYTDSQVRSRIVRCKEHLEKVGVGVPGAEIYAERFEAVFGGGGDE